MKTILLILCVFFSLFSHAQDTVKIKQVDSLVKVINTGNFTVRRDTLKQDNAQLGLSMRTYLTTVMKDSILLKYVNNVHATTKQGAVEEKFVSTNIFYFNGGKLIKVDENVEKGDKKMEIAYYYDDEKLIHFTPDLPNIKKRGESLVYLVKTMIGE
jgi:hypothetical protein